MQSVVVGKIEFRYYSNIKNVYRYAQMAYLVKYIIRIHQEIYTETVNEYNNALRGKTAVITGSLQT